MPFNPLKTRKEWQAVKKTYGIPDKVIKSGSFGEKMEKLAKKFDSLGLGKITENNAKAGIAFAREANLLLDEWLTAARKLPAKDFKDRTKAIAEVESFQKAVRVVRQMSQAKLNPIWMSKHNWKNFDDLWNAARADLDDPQKAFVMYRDGIRNYLGQGLHDAYKLKDVLNLPTTVSAKIVQYEKLADNWNHLNNQNGPLTDEDERAAFWKDMVKARKLGKEIIDLNG
jgi:hypothetical protein